MNRAAFIVALFSFPKFEGELHNYVVYHGFGELAPILLLLN